MMDQSGLLVLRADADSRIGAGHVMRCLALAQEWQSQGGDAIFVGHISAGPLRQRLESEGFHICNLPAAYPDPKDLTVFLPWLHERQCQTGWVALDGYHFDPVYHQALRAVGWSLLIIDDFAHLHTYHADILVNPNAYAGEMQYQTKGETLVLQGGRFALLRNEFRQALDSQEGGEVGRRDCRLLVTMGGADPENATDQVIDALLAMSRGDLEAKIIVGPLNPHRLALEERLRSVVIDAEILCSVADMPSLMRWADLAISAAGSTCWELAALGVPMVVTVLADNQEQVAASLASHGAAINLGWVHDWQPRQVASVIEGLVVDQERRQQMGEKGQRLVDGRGCERVVGHMLKGRTALYLRKVSDSDCRILFDWVNEPTVRAASFHSAPIEWEDHRQWFFAKRQDSNCVHFMAENGQGDLIGQIRFDIFGQEAEIDASVVKQSRGTGLGWKMISQAVEALCLRVQVRVVNAYIKPENQRSMKAFCKAGFCERAEVLIAGQRAVHFIWRPHKGVTP